MTPTAAQILARTMNLFAYCAIAHMGYFMGFASKEPSITRLLTGPDISPVEMESMGAVMVLFGAVGIALEMLR